VIANAERVSSSAGQTTHLNDRVSSGPRQSRGAPWCIAVLSSIYAAILVRTAWITDDAYITLRTIDHFISGYGPRWNVAERVQAFTHPLWFLLLSAVYAVTREPYYTTVVVSLLISLLAFAVLAVWARRVANDWLTVIALSPLLLSRAYVDYSTGGLENPLTHLLLVVFFVVLSSDAPAGPQRCFLLSLLAGLGVLNRMDTILLFGPPLLWELRQARAWRHTGAVILGFLPLLAWEVFAVVYYGYPLPNTAYAKLHTGISPVEYWSHGLGYFENLLFGDPLTPLAILGGLLAGTIRGDARLRASAVGIVLYLLYVIHIGGDFMAGRFFAAPLLLSSVLILSTRAPVDRVFGSLLLVAIVAMGCCGRTPTFLTGRDYGTLRTNLADDAAIVDERAYYYPVTGLLSTAPFARSLYTEWIRDGINARRNHDPILVEGMVGFLGYAAGPDTYVVDSFALGDPLLPRLATVNDPLLDAFCSKVHGGPCSVSWRTGHFRRNLPPGYLESILTDDNRLPLGDLHSLYDAARRITRGDLWTRERWKAILSMNLGLYESPAQAADYQAPDFRRTYEKLPGIRSFTILKGACEDYQTHGAWATTADCYEKLITIDDRDPALWTNLGLAQLMRGDVSGGETALRQAIQRHTDSLTPYILLADSMMKSGRADEAFRFIRELASNGDRVAGQFLQRAEAHRSEAGASGGGSR